MVHFKWMRSQNFHQITPSFLSKVTGQSTIKYLDLGRNESQTDGNAKPLFTELPINTQSKKKYALHIIATRKLIQTKQLANSVGSIC